MGEKGVLEDYLNPKESRGNWEMWGPSLRHPPRVCRPQFWPVFLQDLCLTGLNMGPVHRHGCLRCSPSSAISYVPRSSVHQAVRYLCCAPFPQQGQALGFPLLSAPESALYVFASCRSSSKPHERICSGFRHPVL